jgi:hypothetical protein
VEESQMSDLLRKYGKMMNKVRGTWFDKKGKKSDGVIDEGEAFGLMKLAKPIGAIGASCSRFQQRGHPDS